MVSELNFTAEYTISDIVYLKTDKGFKRPFKVIGYLIDDNGVLYYHCRNEFLDDYYSEMEILNNNLN